MKTAWITGASRGIGYATTELFLQRGWNVVVLTRNTESLKMLKDQFSSQLTLCSVDLNELGTQKLPDLPVNVLINNAGALVNKPMSDITMDDLQYVYRVNVFAPFQLIKRLMHQFSSDAHIINISSVGGIQGSVKFPGLTAYSSSKGALNVLTECLQEEFADSGWSFNALALGAVQTEMLEEAFPGFKAPIAPTDLAPFIVDFSTTGHRVLRGKVLPVSMTTP
ncbi:MAG: hypothetical protein RL754_39 [Bacteroidota bacterium]|jgi:NAD(P)-dependent dehydrogenase (short-subunit alcohol dehydrogenase family)